MTLFLREQIEALIKVGCFDYTGVFRSQLLAVFESMIDNVAETNRRNAAGQLDFFSVDNGEGVKEENGYEYPKINDFDAKEKLLYEKECAGFYFSGNLLDNYANHEKALRCVPIKSIITFF